MKVARTAIPEVLLLEPEVFGDHRGTFFESFNRREFAEKTGVCCDFVQDNHSTSVKGTLRGLHYQIESAQGKLVRAVIGEIFDVAVDIRRGSDTFGKSVCARLSAANRQIIWIPPGFAHGFMALSECAEVLYKTTDYWQPAAERCILWNDPDLDIPWPFGVENPLLSAKDKEGRRFCDSQVFE
jgi:dTDP-4-dehydrorhamnose 3,5-epimerase